MAVRKILRIGDPKLRRKAEPIPVTEIRSAEYKKLIRDMFDTMASAEGVGLAAPQIGVNKRLVVVGFDKGKKENEEKRTIEHKILFNPEITVLDGPKQGYWEGCLSVPKMRGFVERVRKIRLKYYDEKENLHDEVIEGFDAVVYQHECDHLEGILYVDRITDMTKFGFNEELDAAEDQAK